APGRSARTLLPLTTRGRLPQGVELCRTGSRFRPADGTSIRSVRIRTWCRSQQPSGSAIMDDPRAADVVVQGSLLFVEGSDDVADEADHLAEDLRAASCECPAVTDLAAFGIHHLEFASHLPRRGAELAQEQRRIDHTDYDDTELNQETGRTGHQIARSVARRIEQRLGGIDREVCPP